MAGLSKKKQRQIRTSLGEYVRKRYDEAKAYKSDTYDVLKRCLKQIKGEPIGGGR